MVFIETRSEMTFYYVKEKTLERKVRRPINSDDTDRPMSSQMGVEPEKEASRY